MNSLRVRLPDQYDSAGSRLVLGVRRLHGWSQTDVARQLGVCQATVSAWESGRLEPRDVWVRLLREMLI